MDFRRYCILTALLVLAALAVPPVLSAGNLTDIVSNTSAGNVTKIVLNQTGDLENDPANQDYNNGVRSLNIGDCEHAVTYFDQALGQNLSMMKKTDALLYLYQNKAYCLIQLKRYSDAVAAADAGLAVYPKDPMLWNNKGYALTLSGKNEDALKAYTSAVTYDGNYTNAFINQGNLLTEMGRYHEAVTAYTRANETDPFNTAASDGLAAARKGAESSDRTTTIILVIVLIAVAGVIVWYVKIRKPSGPAPQEKKKSRKTK